MAKDPFEGAKRGLEPLGWGWKALSGLTRLGIGGYQLNEQRKANAEAALQRTRNAENDARIKRSFRDAELARKKLENPDHIDTLGGGRLGTLEDAKTDGLLNPNGLFIGVLDGQPIFYNGDAHLLNYGLTRSGKGRDIVLPNLAHVFNRSLVVNDIKDGENAYASADYRASKGSRIIGIDPHGLKLKGIETFQFNPFQRVIDRAATGESIAEDCLQLCMSIVPPTHGSNKWVAEGAQQIIATWLEWAACHRPDICTLSNMWRFVFADFNEGMDAIGNCGTDGLEAQAKMIFGLTQSEDQWSAYQSDLQSALWNFRPDSPLAAVTEKSTFDPAILKHERCTAYLMANSDLLEASARWVSLTMSAMLNTCAQTVGREKVTFVIDELANLPYMAALPKALTLYAGKGVQMWGFCQGRAALREKGYQDHTIKNFESQSGLFHCWSVKESDLIDDIQKWSGEKTVAMVGMNQAGGAVEGAGQGLNHQKRHVLQTDDITAIGDGQQIVRTNGPHLYVMKRIPWFEVDNWKGALKDVRNMHRTQ